jgi:large subunit ribosomal protein L15
MADILSKLGAPAGANTPKKRLGRGVGSGLGKTSGKGQKGQKARNTGNFSKTHFQGGQTPMQRRLPKRGFVNPFTLTVATINVGDLERFTAGTVVDEALLRRERLLRGACDRVKVLGDGTLSKALTVNLDAFSQSAKDKIVAAGGEANVIGAPAEEGSEEAKS